METLKAVDAHNRGVEAQNVAVERSEDEWSHFRIYLMGIPDPDPVRFEVKSSIRLCLYVLKPIWKRVTDLK